MDYALIKNGKVINIIVLHPMNAGEFSNAVSTNNLPIQAGDTYEDGKFYRDGKEITIEQPYTPSEEYAAGYEQALLDLAEVV